MDKKKKYIKIKITAGDISGEVLRTFEKVRVPKIVFVFSKNCSFLSEISFLKKLKNLAEKFDKKIVIIVKRKYFADILKSQNIENYPELPEEFSDTKEQSVDEILKKQKLVAKKNEIKEEIPTTPEPTKGKTKSSSKPEFSLHKISDDKKSIRGYIFFLSLLLIGLLLWVLFWISPSAKIKLKPRVSSIPITQNILIEFDKSEISDENDLLPKSQGIFMETELADTEVFATTGRRYDLTNSHGKVTLYNETNEAKFLVPSRLASEEGLVFRFTKDVTVPAKKDGVAGSVVIELIADEYDMHEKPIGEKGNIEAGTRLDFPALRAELQTKYYAKADQGPLVGGSTLTHYFLDEKDFEKAEPILIDRFRIRAIDQLKKEIANRSKREKKKYVLLDDQRLLKAELLSVEYPTEMVNEETQTFSVQATLKISGVVFDQEEVVKSLREKMIKTQDDRMKLLTIDQNSVDYSVMQMDKLEDENWIKLSVNIVGVETLDLDPNKELASEWITNLQKEIAGKSRAEARGILTNHSEIEEILDFTISPFWNDMLPRIFNRIEFEVVLDK